MNISYLLIGGNLGDRLKNLGIARRYINSDCGEIKNKSAIYETDAWGKTDQPAFLNQALEIETTLTPDQLLKSLLGIEKKLGRRRLEKFGPRIIDIDILLYNDIIIDQPRLKIPHPELANRNFALIPLGEIAPRLIHPVFKKNISTLIEECEDKLAVRKLKD